jgi:alpha-1,2-mannosyltransferase
MALRMMFPARYRRLVKAPIGKPDEPCDRSFATIRVTLTARMARLLGVAVLLACAGFAWRVVPPFVHGALGDFLAFSDFFAQWSFARFVQAGVQAGHAQVGQAALIYDGDALHRFQLTLEPALRQTFPYPYPPTYLFAVWPLGWMPYGVAYLVWDAATLALFLWAVFGTRFDNAMFWFVLLAPATVVALIQGQNGLLTSALLVAGLRLMGERPVLGGVLLGLATIKPQLGVLIPFALIGAGYWRTIAAAAVTAALLAAASGLAFGWDAWPAWLEQLPGHAGYLERSVSDYLKPTIMANLMLFGVAPPVARAIQAFVAAVVAAIVFLCFRRGATGLSIAALQVGTYLAMPYVFRYDMPMLTNAILLLVQDRQRIRRPQGAPRGVPAEAPGESPVGFIEAGIIVLGLLAPALTTVTTRFFYVGGMSLVLLFGLVVWRRWERHEAGH